jgi:trehalose/maltose transport system substrate-binding protein
MGARHTRRHFLAAAATLPLAAMAACRRRGPASSPADDHDAPPPPPVPAAFATPQTDARLVYYGDSVGLGAALDRALAGRFGAETGAAVNVVPRPRDATETHASYQRLFQARSAAVDVLSLDAIWPGAFAPHLLDLRTQLGSVASAHLAAAIANNTVDGRLVAMPLFTDFGILFYRSDLLDKYGYTRAPSTWDELETIAARIQSSERTERRAFVGFVWQGKAYEGLTCNALEWLRSHGGGTILEGGEPTVDNPHAARALARFRRFIGTISPIGVTGYEEEDARNVFQGGNAAFMRNWPYAYAAGQLRGSPIEQRFDVAPLPHEPGYESSATLGGWSLAVSRYTAHPDVSARFVAYLCSPEVQKYRALSAGYIPTIPAVQRDAEVARALPFLARVRDTTIVARPSTQAGQRYNDVSIAFYQGVSKALYGTAPERALQEISRRIHRSLG